MSCKPSDEKDLKILQDIKEHLKLANILLISQKDDTYSANISGFDQSVTSEKGVVNISLAFNEAEKSDERVDFTTNKSYYDSLLQIIEMLQVDKASLNIISGFKNICNSSNTVIIDAESKKSPVAKSLSNKSNKFWLIFFASVLSVLVICTTLIYLENIKRHQSKLVRYDIDLPHSSFLLNRMDLLDKIKQKISDKDTNLVALVGNGGAGKTTLARLYAKQSKARLVWEVHAETKESLIASFEKLAYFLCETEEDIQELGILTSNINLMERSKSLRLFMIRLLRRLPSWLIIYDNVHSIGEIKNYFPHNTNAWGNGKIIITTRDGNIVNNEYIAKENIIYVKSLDDKEKNKLFNKIINDNGKKISSIIIKKRREFLKSIPPFPLDVVMSAYFLKNTSSSYSEYLKYISKPNSTFEQAQVGILKKVGQYHSTRTSIITLSVDEVIKENDDFRDLFLLLSSIHSQNIPRDLLVNYKNELIVRNFLQKLRKFSLLRIPAKDSKNTQYISLHRTTQKIVFNYISDSLILDEYQKIVSEIARQLAGDTNYVGNSDFSKVKIMEKHIQKFLSNSSKIIDKKDQVFLESELANYYLYSGEYQDAKRILERSLMVVEREYGVGHTKVAKILTYLGGAYKEIGEYSLAKDVLRRAINIYHNESRNEFSVIRPLLLLAEVHDSLGELHESKDVLEPLLALQEKQYGLDNIKNAPFLVQLGRACYRDGDHDRAEKLFSRALALYKKHYPTEPMRIVKVLHNLGSLYRKNGEYIKSKEILQYALKITMAEYGESHVLTAKVKVYLAHTYRQLGHYQKAIELLENAIDVMQDKLGPTHIKTAWAQTYLVHIYWDSGRAIESIRTLREAHDIFVTKYGEDNLYSSWSGLRFARVLQGVGEMGKSKKLFDKHYDLYHRHYRDRNIEISWTKAYFASFEQAVGDVEKAHKFFVEALNGYRSHFGRGHIRTAWGKVALGNSFLTLGDLKNATILLEEGHHLY
ncbi:tetratricopeptide repeat protein, partial [Rickettsiaceae bacterium]|nr:tetratricopeptide repeat protein [Rickettsiaceae bacterium]